MFWAGIFVDFFILGTPETVQPTTIAPSHPCSIVCGTLPGTMLCQKCMSSLLLQSLLVGSTVTPITWGAVSNPPTASSISKMCLKCKKIEHFDINILTNCLKKCPINATKFFNTLTRTTKKPILFKQVGDTFSSICLKCSKIKVLDEKTLQSCFFICKMSVTPTMATTRHRFYNHEYKEFATNPETTKRPRQTMLEIKEKPDTVNKKVSSLYFIKSEVMEKIFAVLVVSTLCIVILLVVVIILLSRHPSTVKNITPFRWK